MSNTNFEQLIDKNKEKKGNHQEKISEAGT